MFEYWRIREVLRVFWTTHLKCSVVFDWNTRSALSIKRVHDRIIAHMWGFKSIVNGAYQVFSGVWLEHETHVKYDTCQFKTDFNVRYWGPILKLVYHQNFVQNCSVTHVLIPLSIAWIPNKTHPKGKKTLRQYECYPNKQTLAIMMTSSFHCKWYFIYK